MRAVVQRVRSASVTVADASIAEIGRGLLVLVGFHPDDSATDIAWLADKLVGLRIFPDENKPMNASVGDVSGALLLVPQFTLAADTARGKRPGFSSAAAPEQAQRLFADLVSAVADLSPRLSTREFGANMQVALVNEGHRTIVYQRNLHIRTKLSRAQPRE